MKLFEIVDASDYTNLVMEVGLSAVALTRVNSWFFIYSSATVVI